MITNLVYKIYNLFIPMKLEQISSK